MQIGRTAITRFVTSFFASAIALSACGGKVDASNSPLGTHDAGSDSTTNDDGGEASTPVVTGPGVIQDASSGPTTYCPVPGLMAQSGDNICTGISEQGSCNGHDYKVDCTCPGATCQCFQDGTLITSIQVTANAETMCGACFPTPDPWNACGFPPY